MLPCILYTEINVIFNDRLHIYEMSPLLSALFKSTDQPLQLHRSKHVIVWVQTALIITHSYEGQTIIGTNTAVTFSTISPFNEAKT